MENLILGTAAGEFAVAGRRHVGAPRPTLVTLVGAFPPKGHMHELIDWFPDANVLVAALPGFFATRFVDAGVSELRAAFDDVIRCVAADQPVVVLGISTGCLVTLGLTSPNIRRQVALEPFFSTAGLWPFIDYAAMRRDEAGDASRFLWSFFGVRGGKVLEERDYSDLPERIHVPTDVIVGAEPLGEKRDFLGWPSLTADRDRAALSANPKVRLHEAPAGSGHGLFFTDGGRALTRRVLFDAMHAVAT